MYIDTMQQVYSNVSKVLVESRQGSNLLYLPLDKIMQMSSQGAVAAPADAALGAALPATPAVPASTAPADSRARDISRTRDRDTR
jgi:membrane protease subunit HflK